MKEILLTQGHKALIDDADFQSVNKFKWHVHFSDSKIYARRKRRVFEGKSTTKIYLHSFLLPEASRIDHRDGNGLNCQRNNLRAATPQQNGHGFASKRDKATSKYRGVSWSEERKKWVVQVTNPSGKRTSLGRFSSEEVAARVFDKYVRENYGEFASPNFLL